MLYRNIEVFGASEAVPFEDGTVFLRLPQKVEESLSDHGKKMNRGATGVEFRFVIRSGEARIRCRNASGAEFSRLHVYYGDFCGDWTETELTVKGEYTDIVIRPAQNLPRLREIAGEYRHRFSPDVVRVIPGAALCIQSIEGDLVPPLPGQVPAKKLIAYGSSITHGSMSLAHPQDFVFCLGENLGADAWNLGLAGAARLEREVADYLAEETAYDILLLEMGINILSIDGEDFRERVRYFVRRTAESHPAAAVFAADVFCCGHDWSGNEKPALFRRIVRDTVRELALPNVRYINGLTVLPDISGMTTGLTHPGPRAIRQMTENLTRIIASCGVRR